MCFAILIPLTKDGGPARAQRVGLLLSSRCKAGLAVAQLCCAASCSKQLKSFYIPPYMRVLFQYVNTASKYFAPTLAAKKLDGVNWGRLCGRSSLAYPCDSMRRAYRGRQQTKEPQFVRLRKGPRMSASMLCSNQHCLGHCRNHAAFIDARPAVARKSAAGNTRRLVVAQATGKNCEEVR